MKCLKVGCKEDAEAGSNYCEAHSPRGISRPQIRDLPKLPKD